MLMGNTVLFLSILFCITWANFLLMPQPDVFFMKKESMQKFLIEIFLSFFSGILLTLPFPKLNFTPFAWFSLVPFLIVLEDASPRKAFFWGWQTGIVHFATLLYWVTVSMTNYGNLSEATSFFVLVVLSLYLGLYVGAFGWLLSFFRARYFHESVVISPLIWVLLEFLRTHLFSGFPWGLLGYSQYQHLPLIQISDITGVYGVSFLIVLVNVSLYLIIKWARFRITPFPFLYTIITLSLLLLVIFYGHFRIEAINKINKETIGLQVGLIQGNIDQGQKWNPSYLNETLMVYQNLTVEASRGHSDLMVWPETAVPCYFSPNQEQAPFLQDLAKKIKTPILFGSLAYEGSNLPGENRFFNSAFLIAPKNKEISRYDKVHLVPFGEYVPLKPFLPFIEKMVVGVGDFSPGRKLTLFSIPKARFGVLICYEIIFPDLSRRYCKSGANFLVTITNDAWFGRSSAPYQHFSMAVFRAVENRTAVVRAANSGISGVIEPTGEIQRQTLLFSRTFLKGKIPVNSDVTMYSKYGDIGVVFCGISLVIVMLFNLIINKKDK